MEAVRLEPRPQSRIGRAARWRRFEAVLVVCFLASEARAETNVFPEFKPATARDYLYSVAQMVRAQAGDGADVCLLEARLQRQLGRPDEAERLVRRALKREPQRADLQSFLADLFIREDRMEDALGCLRQAVELDPKIAGSYRRLGMVLDRLGQREEARQAFATAIRQAPDNAMARLLLGRLELDQGHAQEAATQAEKACRLDPGLANAFYVLFQAQTQLGETNAAAHTLKIFQDLKRQERVDMDRENAARDDAKSTRALAVGFHDDAAILFAQQGKTAFAEAHLRQAIFIDAQSPQPRELLATLYVQTGRLADARAVFEELVTLRPKDANCRVNFGTLLLQLKDYPAAITELQRALELDPQQPQALNNLARLYLGAKRDLPEALVLCRRLVARQPTAANYDLLGWALFVNGQAAEARRAAAEAVQREPQNATYQEHLRRLEQLP